MSVLVAVAGIIGVKLVRGPYLALFGVVLLIGVLTPLQRAFWRRVDRDARRGLTAYERELQLGHAGDAREN